MKTVEIIGYRRANLGKTDAERIRQEGSVPCVLYGGGEQIHFYSPVILFRDIVYTNEAHFVHLNIEGEECQAILQEAQFHPVSEIILHADFLRISERSLKHRRDMGMIAFIQEMPNGKVLYDKADLQQHILKNRRNGRS